MRGHVRARGDRWELRAYVGRDPVTGRKKYLTRSFSGSKRAAQQALAGFVTEVGGGGHAALDATVGDLVTQWFELAKPDLSPSTVRGYTRNIETHILPALGKVPLARLGPAQLDRFYAGLRDHGGAGGRPLAPTSVRQVHAILRRALNQGMRWDWISTNPAALASPPRVRRIQLAPPAPEDVLRLIAAAKERDEDFACFLLVSASTGARRGELCALRWSDLDLDAGTLTITRSLVESEGGDLVEKDTKTHAARRIALDSSTVSELQSQRRRCGERALAVGASLEKDTYVFSTTADGRSPQVPNEVTKVFITLRNRVGLTEIRLHDLRHFAATRLLAAGVPVRTVSGRLGHANAATTLGVYAHFLEVSDREAAEPMGALLDGARRASDAIDAATSQGPVPIAQGRTTRSPRQSFAPRR